MSLNQSTIILGATRGIGLATAKELALSASDAPLILVGRSQKRLVEICKALGTKSKRKFVPLALDLMTEESEQKLLHFLQDQDFAFPCHWIFNVGGYPGGKVYKEPYERFEWPQIKELIDFNLLLPMKVTHTILPELLREAVQNESISNLIYMSSQAGFFARPGLTAYAAAKSGLNNFVRSLKGELSETGIKATVIAPGLVDTPLIPEDPKFVREKMIRPEDVARAVSYVLESQAATAPSEIHLTCSQSVF